MRASSRSGRSPSTRTGRRCGAANRAHPVVDQVDCADRGGQGQDCALGTPTRDRSDHGAAVRALSGGTGRCW
jgi:hypothetical protein